MITTVTHPISSHGACSNHEYRSRRSTSIISMAKLETSTQLILNPGSRHSRLSIPALLRAGTQFHTRVPRPRTAAQIHAPCGRAIPHSSSSRMQCRLGGKHLAGRSQVLERRAAKHTDGRMKFNIRSVIYLKKDSLFAGCRTSRTRQ